jgi:hypothetical protein
MNKDTLLFPAVILLLSVFIFLICSFIKINSLMRYLKINKYSRWRQLTTVIFFGAGFNNPKRLSAYLGSNQDDDDEHILRLKDDIKINLKYSALGASAFIVICILTVATLVLMK